MQAVKSRFSNNFELVRWVTYVFIGGAVYASIWQVYADFLFGIPQIFGGPLPAPLGLITIFVLPSVLIFVVPLFLSIILTRSKPEKQLVPPLYINLVAFAWFMGFALIRYTADIIVAFALFGIVGFFGGTLLNRVAIYLLGIAVNPDDFESYSFTVQTDFKTVQSMIEIEKYRENIGIIRSELDEEKSVLTLIGRGAYHFVLEVGSNAPSVSCAINAAFYDRADWYVKPKSEGLKESVEAVASYLKSIFERNQINIIDVGSKETPGTQLLVRSIMDEMEGVIPRYRQVSRIGWLKIGALIGAVIFIGVSAFIFRDLPTSIGSFIVLLLYVVFELRSGREGP